MDHDGGAFRPALSTVVVTWPKGSFAENLAVADDGEIFVTLHTDRAIVRVDPLTGSITPFATFDTPVAGLALMTDGGLIVSGGTPGRAGGVVFHVSRDGRVARLADLPEAAFLNGVTTLPGGERFLIAESLGGAIYACDPARRSVELWLKDPLLAPPEPNGTPGANGLKVFDAALHVSVTGADRILRCSLDDQRSGRLTVFAERLRADDFAFAIDGSLLIATHPAHSLVRLEPDGGRTTLAGAGQGLTGATAVAFGRGANDRSAVYVTTTGGTMVLPPDHLEPAKLFRVETGITGAPLHSNGRTHHD